MPPQEFFQNPRRSPRFPARCHVEVLHGAGRWHSVTQDIGPGGCQIVSAGPIQAGARVALSVTSAEVAETLQVTGRVAWASPPLARAGISFSAGRGVANWFDRFSRAHPAATGDRAAPDRLAAEAALYLGPPPAGAMGFRPAELLVLGLVSEGATVGQLHARLGQRWAEARGPLFGLLARKHLVLKRPEAVPPSRWRALLTDAQILAEVAALGQRPLQPPEPGAEPGRATLRPAPAQQCVERALACLRAGEVHDAVAHLRTALGFAPRDPVICMVLAGLDPRR